MHKQKELGILHKILSIYVKPCAELVRLVILVLPVISLKVLVIQLMPLSPIHMLDFLPIKMTSPQSSPAQ